MHATGIHVFLKCTPTCPPEQNQQPRCTARQKRASRALSRPGRRCGTICMSCSWSRSHFAAVAENPVTRRGENSLMHSYCYGCLKKIALRLLAFLPGRERSRNQGFLRKCAASVSQREASPIPFCERSQPGVTVHQRSCWYPKKRW